MDIGVFEKAYNIGSKALLKQYKEVSKSIKISVIIDKTTCRITYNYY